MVGNYEVNSLSAFAVDGHCPTLDFFSKLFLILENVDAWSGPQLELVLELHGVIISSAWLVHVDVDGSRLGCTELFFSGDRDFLKSIGGRGVTAFGTAEKYFDIS